MMVMVIKTVVPMIMVIIIIMMMMITGRMGDDLVGPARSEVLIEACNQVLTSLDYLGRLSPDSYCHLEHCWLSIIRGIFVLFIVNINVIVISIIS